MSNSANMSYLAAIAKSLRSESGKFVVLATPAKVVRFSPEMSANDRKDRHAVTR